MQVLSEASQPNQSINNQTAVNQQFQHTPRISRSTAGSIQGLLRAAFEVVEWDMIFQV